jgi:Ca-activated chloride channel homolog
VHTAWLDDPRVVWSLVRLTVDQAAEPATPRRPVNLSLVIDRSSSMRGPRLRQAVLATRKLIERLDERDRLAIITFDATAYVLQPPGPVTEEVRGRLGQALDHLTTGAGTNLAAGWKKGCELASAGFVREAIARVVLLTDGLPSVGVRDAGRLARIAEDEAGRGVTTTTMGIGEGFDDQLLSELARAGKGGFYYLATPEAIPAAFGRELEGVFAVAATQVELKVVAEADVMSCEVLHRLDSRAAAEGLTVQIGELAAGAPRQVLLRFTRNEGAGKLVAKIAVTFRDPAGRPADAHLARVEVADPPPLTEVAECTLERLRLQAAAAIDDAWARRAGGQREEAIGSLTRVRNDVADALDRKQAPAAALEGLVSELAGAEAAVRSAAQEAADQHRRRAREKSHITLMGQSQVGPVPTPPPGEPPADDSDD